MTPPGLNRLCFLAGLALTSVAPAAELPTLLPPVRVAGSSPPARPPGSEPLEYTPIPATNLPTVPVPEPRPEDAEKWRRNPRWVSLSVEVRGGTATISGRARTHEAAWELADEVREWSAVRRVVVGKVEVLASGGR